MTGPRTGRAPCLPRKHAQQAHRGQPVVIAAVPHPRRFPAPPRTARAPRTGRRCPPDRGRVPRRPHRLRQLGVWQRRQRRLRRFRPARREERRKAALEAALDGRLDRRGRSTRLEAAVKAGGAEFKSIASAGGGTVVKGEGPTAKFAEDTYKELANTAKTFHPDVIAYQVTTYDWGTAAQQTSSYEHLAKVAKDAGAELVIVSAPPFKIDDFYKSHEAAIKSAPKAAQDAAAKNAGQARFFDAAALWGTDSAAAKAQRSQDGIHTCQQGAAAFANWFGGQLSRHYSFTPAAPEKWAKGPWTGSKVYGQLKCG